MDLPPLSRSRRPFPPALGLSGLSVCLAGLAAALAAPLFLLPTGAADEAAAPEIPEYRPDPDFFQIPEDLTLGSVAGVAFTSRGEIVVTHRGARPILIFDGEGQLLRSFGYELFPGVHGTRIDAEDTIWITDMRVHTVHRFSLEGEELLRLGERGVSGDDERLFNRPTDTAFGRDGAVFVSDGYGNSRVVKVDPEGRYLGSWGEPGAGAGEFHLPHGVFVDGEGLVHVADRENDRIQVFDQEGSYLREYGGFAPFGVFLGEGPLLYVADGRAHEVLVTTLEGEVLSRFGQEGEAPGEFRLPHGIGLGPDGALYVTEIEGRRIQRFLPVER